MSHDRKDFEEFERVVRSVLEAKIREDCPDADLRVVHNKRFRGKSGTRHQIDVSAELSLGEMKVWIIAECRFYSHKKVTQEEILGLAGRIEDLGANKGLFVTTVRFQRGAKEIAKSKGIALVTKGADDSCSWDIVLPALSSLFLLHAFRPVAPKAPEGSVREHWGPGFG